MIINLNHQWRIRSDELQWNLEYLPDPNPGTKRKTERWKAKGHFRTLDEAVLRCARRQIRLLPMVVGAEALPCLCTALDRIEAGQGRCRRSARRLGEFSWQNVPPTSGSSPAGPRSLKGS
jgi:hypothetical protein